MKIIKNPKSPQKMKYRLFGCKTERYPAIYLETENIADLQEIFEIFLTQHPWITITRRLEKNE